MLALLLYLDERICLVLVVNQISSGNNTAGGHRDPRDAAQAPPSVVRQHIGDPSIEHGGERY